MRRFFEIRICRIGFASFVFSLFFILSIFLSYLGSEIMSFMFYFFVEGLRFSMLGIILLGIITLILGLFAMFRGAKLFPSVGVAVFRITMLTFGIFSILVGLRFFAKPLLQWYYRITQILILASGIIYIISSISLSSGLKNLTRKLVFSYSVILLLYFVPFSIFLAPVPFGWGPVMLLSFSPFIIIPIFFIIFLIRHKVKE